MVACRWCKVDCVRVLLDHGACFKGMNSFGETAMDKVVDGAMGSEADKVQTLALLRRESGGSASDFVDDCGDTLLHSEARLGMADTLQEMLDDGAEANVRCQGGCCCTPLMVACRWCHVECAKVLLEHRADLEQVNDHGETAIDQAMHMALGSSEDRALVLSMLQKHVPASGM